MMFPWYQSNSLFITKLVKKCFLPTLGGCVQWVYLLRLCITALKKILAGSQVSSTLEGTCTPFWIEHPSVIWKKKEIHSLNFALGRFRVLSAIRNVSFIYLLDFITGVHTKLHIEGKYRTSKYKSLCTTAMCWCYIVHYDSCTCEVSNHFFSYSQVINIPSYLPLLWFITQTLSLVYTLNAMASSGQIIVTLMLLSLTEVFKCWNGV